MPARSPRITPRDLARLQALGRQIRQKRNELGLTAVSTAEAAGLSRVTLHRIERGEPSVTMGAYCAVLSALGLELSVEAALAEQPTAAVRLADFPVLRGLSWHLAEREELSAKEALAIYERNWKHVDREELTAQERELIETLARTLGRGSLLV